MSYTALSEQLGGSDDVTINSPGIYRARLPYGPNGCRLYVIRPTVAGVIFRMPDPALMTTGAAPLIVVINKGPEALQLTNFGGINIGAALTANQAAELWLPIVGVDTWLPIGPSTVTSGSALAGTRKPIELVYTASTTGGTNFRTDAARQFGYIGADGPVALQVTVKTGVVLGQAAWTDLLFGHPPAGTTTGGWPAGSTCLLIVESGAYIQGRGGDAGLGATSPATAGSAGSRGGAGLECLMPTTIVNNGFVRGGGGGGGGGNRVTSPTSINGGHGGAGAGAPPGNPGPSGPQQGSQGATLEAGGFAGQIGGGFAGGIGGNPGAAGANGSGIGGLTGGAGAAGGPAIRRPTAVSVTQLGSGVYTGGTVTF